MTILIEREGAGYGWVAFDDDAYDGPGSPIGHGKTETEAYQELLLQLWDRGPRWRTDELTRLLQTEFSDDEWEHEEQLDPDRLREDAEDRRAAWK